MRRNHDVDLASHSVAADGRGEAEPLERLDRICDRPFNAQQALERAHPERQRQGREPFRAGFEEWADNGAAACL